MEFDYLFMNNIHRYMNRIVFAWYKCLLNFEIRHIKFFDHRFFKNLLGELKK